MQIEKKKFISNLIIWLVVVGLLGLAFALYHALITIPLYNQNWTSIQNFASYGDYFGGVVSTILTFISVLFIALSLFEQQDNLERTLTQTNSISSKSTILSFIDHKQTVINNMIYYDKDAASIDPVEKVASIISEIDNLHDSFLLSSQYKDKTKQAFLDNSPNFDNFSKNAISLHNITGKTYPYFVFTKALLRMIEKLPNAIERLEFYVFYGSLLNENEVRLLYYTFNYFASFDHDFNIKYGIIPVLQNRRRTNEEKLDFWDLIISHMAPLQKLHPETC